jgi:hypothetical protein
MFAVFLSLLFLCKLTREIDFETSGNTDLQIECKAGCHGVKWVKRRRGVYKDSKWRTKKQRGKNVYSSPA